MPIRATGTAYAAMEIRDPKIISRGLYVTSGNQYFDAGWPATTGFLTSGANFGLSGHYTTQAQIEPYSNTTGTEHCIGILIRRQWAITTDRINDPTFRRNCEILKFGVYRMRFVGGNPDPTNDGYESELVSPVPSGFCMFQGSVSGQVILGKLISPHAITGQYADIFINPMKMVY